MDIYMQYAEFARKINELTDEHARIKPKLMGYVRRIGEPVRKSYGTFSIAEYPRYEYSAQVKKLEAQLKELQKQERENGTAKKTVTESLRFQSK